MTFVKFSVISVISVVSGDSGESSWPYINIVQKTSGIAPKNLGNSLDPKLDKNTISEVTENYRNHPSIIKIKEIVNEKPIFDFPEATAEGINEIIK